MDKHSYELIDHTPFVSAPDPNQRVHPSVMQSGLKEYAMSEVSKHNKTGDMWIVMGNKIYDMSSYKHPGG